MLKKVHKPALVLLVVSSLVLGTSVAYMAPPAQGVEDGEYIPGEILVKFKPGVSAEAQAATHRALGAKIKGRIHQIGVQVLSVPADQVLEKVAAYQKNPNVEYAEPNYVVHAVQGPNDPDYSKQWALNNTGEVEGTPDADIDWEEAWTYLMGASMADVVIAIVDSGIDPGHPDLNDKLVAGYDFVDDDSDPKDGYGHGTHVSGIAAAETHNFEGIAGVAFPLNIKIMPVRVLDDSGIGTTSDVAEGIIWAADQGAKAINLSLGTYFRSRTLRNAVNYAWDSGCVLAAAAGNDGNPRKLYPASYPNAMSVGATDSTDTIASFSNHNDEVDVSAPGVHVYSTFPTYPFGLQEKYPDKSCDYDYGSGTSMSTPHVAGLAALLFAQAPNRSNADVRGLIEQTANDLGEVGWDPYYGHGRIDAYQAVTGPVPTPTPTPAPGGKMHVKDITMDLTSVQRGPNLWTYATATVTIVDADDNPVEAATVSGHWSEATADSDSGDTGADGKVSLKSDKVKTAPSGTTFTFTVDDVALSGWTYDPSANVETSDYITVQ